LRAVAWAALCLDLVVFAQLGYGLLTQRSGPDTDPALRGLTVMLGSGLLGVVILLVVSSRLHSRAGLWIALACAALPLLWTRSSKACGNDCAKPS
jgi:hypothetical protein